jgi:O-antigen/teichoic acid export membrane protein
MTKGGLVDVARASAPSIGTGFGGQVALVVSGIVAARILGVEDRGHLALLALFPAALAQFGSLGVPLSVTFFVATRPSDARLIVRTAFVMGGVQALALLVAHAAILAVTFADAEPDVRRAAIYTLVAVPVSLANHYALALLQGQGRLLAFNLLRVLAPVAYTAWLVVLLAADAGNLERVTAAWVAASAGVAALTLFVARVHAYLRGSGRFSPRTLLGFGLRSVIGSVSPVETFRIDQAVVGLVLSPAALGIYVVGMAFTNLPRFIGQSIGYVAYPQVARERDVHARGTVLWRFTVVAVLLCGAVVAILELAAGYLVPLFFGEEFRQSVSVTRILLVSGLLLGIRRVVTEGARGAGRTLPGSAAEAVSWVVLLPSMVLLARWGADGIAAAVVLASLASLIVVAASVLLGGAPRRAPMVVTDVVVEPLDYATGVTGEVVTRTPRDDGDLTQRREQ